MNALNNLLSWLNRHRRTIFYTLIFALLFQICTSQPKNSAPEEQKKTEYHESAGENQLKSYEQLEDEQIKKISDQQSPAIYTYLLMVALVLIVFLIQRKNLLQYLIPQRVTVSSSLIRNQQQNLIKLRMINRTRETVEFNHAVLIFSTLRKSRNFKLSNDDFPLLLSPDTGHAITFSIDKLTDNIPELKKFPFVRLEIQTGKKTYKTLPSWIRWR